MSVRHYCMIQCCLHCLCLEGKNHAAATNRDYYYHHQFYHFQQTLQFRYTHYVLLPKFINAQYTFLMVHLEFQVWLASCHFQSVRSFFIQCKCTGSNQLQSPVASYLRYPLKNYFGDYASTEAGLRDILKDTDGAVPNRGTTISFIIPKLSSDICVQ